MSTGFKPGERVQALGGAGEVVRVENGDPDYGPAGDHVHIRFDDGHEDWFYADEVLPEGQRE